MTWGTVKIGRLCDKTGMTDPRRKPDVSFRYIDISGIDRELKRIATTTDIAGADAPSRARQVVKVNDVLVSTVRPNLNAVATVPTELDGEIASTGFCVLRAVESVLEPRLLFYFTRSEQFINTLLQHVRGANYPAVTDRNVLDVEIPWPAKSEQQRIVEILDQADALRRQRRAADEKAQRILPAVFRNMFGDPVSNPMGWDSGVVGDVVEETQYGTSQRASEGNSGLPVLRMNNIDRFGRIDISDLKYIDLPASEAAKYMLCAGDILFNRTNSRELVGKTGLWQAECKAVAASYLIRVRVKRQKVLPEFLWACMNSQSIKNVLFAKARRAIGMANINASELRGLPVIIPPMPLQERFVERLNAAELIVRKQIDNQRRFEDLFALLLHRAFTGELTTKWRDTHRNQLEAEMREQLAALERPKADRPTRGRQKRGAGDAEAGFSDRHAGHDMFNKAALVTYIVAKCHDPARPNAMGRTKLAKLFYLVQRRAEISLTQQFARRAAGPLDDAIHKFLNLAKKNGWLALPSAQGNLKPVIPGRDPQPAINHVRQRWAAVLPAVDQMLDTMKGWGWEALERWATVEHAAQNILAEGRPVTLATVKAAIAACPEWQSKLDRPAFSDSDIQSTLKGLRNHGFLPALAGANC